MILDFDVVFLKSSLLLADDITSVDGDLIGTQSEDGQSSGIPSTWYIWAGAAAAFVVIVGLVGLFIRVQLRKRSRSRHISDIQMQMDASQSSSTAQNSQTEL